MIATSDSLADLTLPLKPYLEPPLRILAVSQTWEGANCYSFVCALRRAGHSVTVVSDETFLPAGWRHPMLKAMRRALKGALTAEYNRHLIEAASALQPDLLFVYKGTYVSEQALETIKKQGAVAVNVYPDIAFNAHSSTLAQTMRLYDWVFTTKSFHLEAPPAGMDARRLSFLAHGFDPKVHRQLALSSEDRARYDADVACAATWTPGKERRLATLHARLPDARIRVWGNQWDRAKADLGPDLMKRGVHGTEYAKAIQAAPITLAPLSEQMSDAARGDLVTARTFEIPAAGGFMLHERNAEVLRYFAEDRECAMFSGDDEMVDKVRSYLSNPEKRKAIAAAGHARCISSGYSVDDRARTVVAKAFELGRRTAQQ